MRYFLYFIKHFLYSFLRKMKYFFVALYDKSVDNIDFIDNECNVFIISFFVTCPILVFFSAVFSFIVVLLFIIPIILICDIFVIFIRFFEFIFKMIFKI